jgi:hypothetical protein
MRKRKLDDFLEAFSDTITSTLWQIHEVMVFRKKVLSILYYVREGEAQVHTYIITMKQNAQFPFSCADNLANNSSFSPLF